MTEPEARQPNTMQCYQWARSAHATLVILSEQAETYIPAAGGMDSDTADEIVGALAQATVALATAYGVYMLDAERAQQAVNSTYQAHQSTGGRQYQPAGGTTPWPPQ
jgi:hypothetical protein